MTTRDHDILDDLFHGSAFVAYLEQAHAQQNWPEPEATRRHAYRLYEQSLSAKTKSPEKTVVPESPAHKRFAKRALLTS